MAVLGGVWVPRALQVSATLLLPEEEIHYPSTRLLIKGQLWSPLSLQDVLAPTYLLPG